MSVVVFGSINIDLVARTARLPVAGETVSGHQFFTAPGGKGANQAVASARMGAKTRMIGRVGGDVFGETLRSGLAGDGVDTSQVTIDAEQSSGVAVIAVNDAGENTIIVVPGANGTFAQGEIERLDSALGDATVLLLQLEIPMEMVVAAAERARARGVTVIVDPAPARELPSELYRLTDILTPNEIEAAALVGFALNSSTDVERAAQVLRTRGAANVVIKLGGKGAYWASSSGASFLSPFQVTVVDTVAAGDAFNGAVAAALAEDQELASALRWGLAAGALAVTKSGAQPSLPDRAAVFELLGPAAV